MNLQEIKNIATSEELIDRALRRASKVEEKVRNINSSEPSSDETSVYYKNYFEDKIGSKVEVQSRRGKFKVILNFNSSEALKTFVEKIN